MFSKPRANVVGSTQGHGFTEACFIGGRFYKYVLQIRWHFIDQKLPVYYEPDTVPVCTCTRMHVCVCVYILYVYMWEGRRMLNYLDTFFYFAFHVDLYSLDELVTLLLSIVICPLKLFFRLWNIQNNHISVFFMRFPPTPQRLGQLWDWGPHLLALIFPLSLHSCHPRLLQSRVKVRDQIFMIQTASPAVMAKRQPTYENKHSFHLHSSWDFFSKHIHILSLTGLSSNLLRWAGQVTNGETGAWREVTFSVSDKAESRAPASWFQILVFPVDHTAINRTACYPQF